MSAPRSVFVLRRGLFGFRRVDVVAALDEQRRQIETLALAVERVREERDRAWGYSLPASGSPELDASRRLDEISEKLDRVLGIDATPAVAEEPEDADARQVYVSELGDLRRVRERRIARSGD